MNAVYGGINVTVSAYIKLKSKSLQQDISLEELKRLFGYYKDITGKTGQQLSWSYDYHAFPYEMHDVVETPENMFYLKGIDDKYYALIVKIGKETLYREEGKETSHETYIEILLPNGATNGDKGKANEFCKFLAKKLAGELHLFNGRIMYFYKR
jgi:hypothetical protein